MKQDTAYFARPSTTFTGLAHYVKVNEEMNCSCPAKLYQRGKPYCSHIFDVRLGETSPARQIPAVDGLVSVLLGLDAFILSGKGLEPTIFTVNNQIYRNAGLNVSDFSNPVEGITEIVKDHGYQDIGVFFNPIAKSPDTIKRVSANKLKLLNPYFQSAISNHQRAYNDPIYAVAAQETLHDVLTGNKTHPGFNRLLKTLKLQFENKVDYEQIEDEIIEDIRELLKTKSTTKPHYKPKLKDAEIDIAVHTKRRDSILNEFKTNAQTFSAWSNIVKKNIGKGLFIREFLSKAYESLELTIPDEIFNLPTHELELVYCALTNESISKIRLFSSR